MYGSGQSYSSVVPAKPSNKAAPAAAEAVEERELVEENAAGKTRSGHRAGMHVSRALDCVRQVAERDKKVRFTALLHHVTMSSLKAAYWGLKPEAAAGVDGVTWGAYGQSLEANLEDLHRRLHSGAYRAKPSRRVYIPKAGGRQRPLGIASLEDKIVQSAVVEVLKAVYEADFLGFSYGFRPGRGQHDALDALTVGIERRKVSWLLDADISNFFGRVDHSWLAKFVEHRIADKRILRLVQKWVKAGVIEDGSWTKCEEGTPQGATISPLLANVYLHYVLDLWVEQWRRRKASGDVVFVRYADDYIAGFEHREDAERFRAELRQRLAKFGLELHPEKTRLIEFRAVRRRTTSQAGTRGTRDLQFPGLHTCVQPLQGRKVQGKAQNDGPTDARQVEGSQGRTQATAASASPGAGAVAKQRGAWAPRLLRRAGQHESDSDLQNTGNTAVVQSAEAPEPTHAFDLGAYGPPRQPMVVTCPRATPLSPLQV
jgi:RNA-directed DNA polymerase